MERVASDLAIAVDKPRRHLDQHGLTGSGHPVADEREQEPAQLHEGVQLAFEIVGHQHLSDAQGLRLGQVVAHDFGRLLEAHDELGALLPRRHVEAVEREVIAFDPNMSVLERPETGEAAATFEQFLQGDPRIVVNQRGKLPIVLRLSHSAIEACHKGLQRVLRRFERQFGCLRFRQSFIGPLNHPRQICCERKGRHVGGRCRQRSKLRCRLAL